MFTIYISYLVNKNYIFTQMISQGQQQTTNNTEHTCKMYIKSSSEKHQEATDLSDIGSYGKKSRLPSKHNTVS